MLPVRGFLLSLVLIRRVCRLKLGDAYNPQIRRESTAPSTREVLARRRGQHNVSGTSQDRRPVAPPGRPAASPRCVRVPATCALWPLLADAPAINWSCFMPRTCIAGPALVSQFMPGRTRHARAPFRRRYAPGFRDTECLDPRHIYAPVAHLMLLPHMHYYVSLIHENLERWHQGDTGRMKGREHVSSRIKHENPSPRIRQIAQGGVDLGRVALGIMMWIAVGRVVITRGGGSGGTQLVLTPIPGTSTLHQKYGSGAEEASDAQFCLSEPSWKLDNISRQTEWRNKETRPSRATAHSRRCCFAQPFSSGCCPLR